MMMLMTMMMMTMMLIKTTREKYNAVIDDVVKLTSDGRPVLVGTTSVEISELLSRMLKMKKIEHTVLNAKLHAKEADVVANAGKPGAVTIATNMAGRGTDIKLTDEVKASAFRYVMHGLNAYNPHKAIHSTKNPKAQNRDTTETLPI